MPRGDAWIVPASAAGGEALPEGARAGTDACEASVDEVGAGTGAGAGTVAVLGGVFEGIRGPAVDRPLYPIDQRFFIMRKADLTAETACCGAASSHFIGSAIVSQYEIAFSII